MNLDTLPPREREIVTLLYRGEALSPTEIAAAMAGDVSTQAVRSMLARLEAKGVVARRKMGRTFVYEPKVARTAARKSALSRLVGTFFGGSSAEAASALIGMSRELDDEELDELESMIAEARARRAAKEKK